MKQNNIAPKLKSNLDTKSEQYKKNKEMMLEKLKFLDGLLDLAEIGGVCTIMSDWQKRKNASKAKSHECLR